MATYIGTLLKMLQEILAILDFSQRMGHGQYLFIYLTEIKAKMLVLEYHM